MQVHCRDVVLMPVASLKPHPKNRNAHPPEQIQRLAKILEHQGWRYPVKVSKLSGYVTSGHGRIEAAKLLGWTEVPVSEQDYVDEAQEYADVVSDNAIASWSELDFSGIGKDVIDLGPSFDVELLGLKDPLPEIEVLEPGCDEDEVPEAGPAYVVPGDVFTLGRHRIMCGDSTMIDDVERLVPAEGADVTFTSPPYNAAATPGGLEHSRYRKYLNWEMDAKSEEGYAQFLSDFLSLAIVKTKLQIVNLQMLEGGKRSIIKWLYDYKDNYLDQLVWIKSTAAPTPPNTITPKHELIFIFSNETKPNKRIKTKDFSHFFSVVENPGAGGNTEADTHRATFPVGLCEKILDPLAPDLGSVYEPFGGSGSTLIACEKTNRQCFMMELDPKYCTVILDRWAKYTGKDPVREDGKPWSEIKNG